MTQVRIITNAVSEGANELTTCLRELGITVTKARNMGGKVFAKRGVPTIKWGCFPLVVELPAGTPVLNGTADGRVLNKLQSFIALREAGVPVPDFTSQIAEAQLWLTNGERVYERHTLRGSGGEGIRVVRNNNSAESGLDRLTSAPLYVKGMLGKRREYRIHVFTMGSVNRLFIQQKKRRQGYVENETFSNEVRNLDAGWIFAHNDIQPPRTATVDAAVAAVTALGLNFGGVDVIEMDRIDGGSVVLEINSAPGLQGSTAGFYAQAIQQVI